jgi:hypothetical protein
MTQSLLAYVGPGPGLTMVWAFVALLATVGLALLTALLWPVRMLLKRRKNAAQPPQDPAAGGDATTR